jgi:hypothetical protein
VAQLTALQGMIRDFMLGLGLWQAFILVAIGFNAIYFGLAGFTLLMTRRILPRFGIGRVIDGRRIPPLQIRREVRLSLDPLAGPARRDRNPVDLFPVALPLGHGPAYAMERGAFLFHPCPAA